MSRPANRNAGGRGFLPHERRACDRRPTTQRPFFLLGAILEGLHGRSFAASTYDDQQNEAGAEIDPRAPTRSARFKLVSERRRRPAGRFSGAIWSAAAVSIYFPVPAMSGDRMIELPCKVCGTRFWQERNG